MTVFRVSERSASEENSVREDDRTLVEKMFYDYNEQTGEKVPLEIVVCNDNYKQVHDCIPLIRGYRSEDENYTGPLKGKNVIVVGGRRRSRAGTGVEFLIAVDQIDSLVTMLKDVEIAANQYLQ